ncbi:MAG: ABC transporter ATP-binding protein [Candidatus Nanopelagicales bacterium]|nr:ABC transporter ATP-binding protein [Candidatus Nanopelagicales bacterium]
MTGEAGGVRVGDLMVGYGGQPVLENLELFVPPGEIAAIRGSSGSGKTTLLRALAGFLRPQRGTIELGGQLVSGPGVWMPTERRNIGLVPQEGALFPHLDVAGNVGFGLPRRTRGERRATAERVAYLLALVDLPGSERLRPHELSGGMQQRVAVARALAREPSCILLDEPFSALDADLRRELREQVRRLLKKVGTTAILVTHDEAEAREFADRVHRMSGRQLD